MPQLRKVSGERGGVVVESLVIIVMTLGLAFYFSWQLALVNMAFMPALIFVGALQVSNLFTQCILFELAMWGRWLPRETSNGA